MQFLLALMALLMLALAGISGWQSWDTYDALGRPGFTVEVIFGLLVQPVSLLSAAVALAALSAVFARLTRRY